MDFCHFKNCQKWQKRNFTENAFFEFWDAIQWACSRVKKKKISKKICTFIRILAHNVPSHCLSASALVALWLIIFVIFWDFLFFSFFLGNWVGGLRIRRFGFFCSSDTTEAGLETDFPLWGRPCTTTRLLNKRVVLSCQAHGASNNFLRLMRFSAI